MYYPSPIAELGETDLTAKDLRAIAGLSYRQIHQWGQKGLISDDRRHSASWRRVNGWDAIGLRVIADLKRQLGVPPQKQRQLFRWLTGRELSGGSRKRLAHAEDVISGLSTRNWGTTEWREFKADYCRLIDQEFSGVQAMPEIQLLLDKAHSRNDDKASDAVQMLGAALLPLYQALGMVNAGLIAVLATDLWGYYILPQEEFGRLAGAGSLPSIMVSMRINDAFNAVLDTKK